MLTTRQRLLLLAPLAVLVIPLVICPALLGLVASLTSFSPFRAGLRWQGLANYSRLLNDDLFRVALGNALLLTLSTVTLEVVLGVLLAYLLRKPFRGRGWIRFALLLPWLLSPAASGVMWLQLLDGRTGLMNFFPALIGHPNSPYLLRFDTAFLIVIATEVWRKAPLVTFLVLPGVLAIPHEQWDVARLDGLSTRGTFRHVVLPATSVLLLTISLLLIGETLGASESISFLTGGGPGTRTLTIGLYSFNKAVDIQNWQQGATSAWFIAALIGLAGWGYLRLIRLMSSRR